MSHWAIAVGRLLPLDSFHRAIASPPSLQPSLPYHPFPPLPSHPPASCPLLLPAPQATCKDFTVGRASCSASSVVTLFPDRLEYKFSHSSQGRIDMVGRGRGRRCRLCWSRSI